MRPISLIFLSIIIIAYCSGCSENIEGSSNITIQGTVLNPSVKNISAYTLTPFDEMIPLTSAPLDSSGHFVMHIDSSQPMEAYLLYGKQREELFLEPGFNLNISFNARDFKNSMTFKATGSIENSFLIQMESLTSEYLAAEYETILQFSQIVQAYQQQANDMISTLASGKGKVSDLFILIQKNKVENVITRSYMNYVSSFKYRAPSGSEDFELPEDILNFWSRLDLQNSDLLYSRDYRKILNNFIADQTERNISRIQSEGDHEKDRSKAEKLALEEFLESKAQPEIKEYILASNISDRLEFNGFKSTKPDFESFIRTYPDSRFTELLNKRFAVWLNIDKGRPGPDFRGTTPEGDTIRLSDMKDYVIYIDVWASWCKPCYEEFPYSTALRKRFSPEEPVRFMYVSIDDELAGWLKGLDRIPEVEGVHILVENAWRSEFAEKYVVKDIPRYILIDRAGRIADIEADRPSSTQVLETKIRSLL